MLCIFGAGLWDGSLDYETRHYLEPSEMLAYKRTWKIKWIDKEWNAEVLEIIWKQNEMLYTIKEESCNT